MNDQTLAHPQGQAMSAALIDAQGRVRVLRLPRGQDFNDLWRERGR